VVSKDELPPGKHANLAEPLDDDYNILLENMAYDPISIDKLIECTGLTVDAVSSMLLILELQGLVLSCPGGFYVRVN
jgi:DNA processing protein